ncbi:MAG: DUF4065 domain-containing protein [Candidatus Gracilibacteria bacterium]|nr:DUF4065 domain-containing protein [Candidatus Gracilibacteria bacterium]
MSYNIKDLQKLVKSKDFESYQLENLRFINLGEKIYGRRKDLGLTQTELGKLSQIPQNKISEMESGTYGDPGYEILNKLSKGLNISVEYLDYDSITRKTVELYNHVFSKIKDVPDIMQFMKIPYFIDLEFIKNHGKQITNFEYIRWNYGPFDKKVYDYQKLFSFDNEKGIKDIKPIYLTADEINVIDTVLSKIPKDHGQKLKELSYQTLPMKSLGVCLGDNKCMGEKLILK